ncbi:MAG: sugar ABC transporter ATP-binding protein, partial [Acetobacteraceae bacterium]
QEASRPGYARINAPVDVVEPMGMETMVHFFIDGQPMCARCEPTTQAAPDEVLPLTADLNNMHLMEQSSGRVV